ncbi:MAG: hypothetical protein C6H99_06385 [Epsilonproteobacteria bacterium]|nr:hypothetical protein [Campylobacterota bacterium]NPA64304.1 peptidoglycan DD-metalloendopeptidase family protein [Campylobacterota bacterium]
MRHIILALLILIGSGYGSIDQKIKKTKSELRKTNKELRTVHLKLQRLSKQIRTLERELKSIDKRLKNLDQELSRANERYKEKKEAYDKTQKLIQDLTQKEIELRERLMELVSKEFSKSLLLTSMENPTQEDIIKEEILRAIQKKEELQIRQVSKQFAHTQQKLKSSKKKLVALRSQIEDLLKKQSELKRLKLIKAKKLKSYESKKRSYDRTLQQLTQERASLQKTLQRLSILKRPKKSKIKVKNYGQKSYKKAKTTRYKGPKTIPPLDRFIILKRFGTYKDPIYNIEIPNENIELKPLEPNAKVRNVLNGRVILAKWTPHLKNVVIVKHAGGLYTIYAYLDKLAPYIKKGRKLKKGYTIGRVNNKLIFEVTKNNSHIDPLDLIKVK